MEINRDMVSLVVHAGGWQSRMGEDKVLITFPDSPLMQQLVEWLAPIQ